jgi:hypothetical protein
MDTLVNSFFILSIILFLAGILGIFVKAFKEKFKIRYFFLASIICFSLSLTFGWEDALKGFQEGYNDAVCCNDTDNETSDD